MKIRLSEYEPTEHTTSAYENYTPNILSGPDATQNGPFFAPSRKSENQKIRNHEAQKMIFRNRLSDFPKPGPFRPVFGSICR